MATTRSRSARQQPADEQLVPATVRDPSPELEDPPQLTGAFAKLSPEIRNMIYEVLATDEASAILSNTHYFRLSTTTRFARVCKAIRQEYPLVLLAKVLQHEGLRDIYYSVMDLDFDALVEDYLSRIQPIDFRQHTLKVHFTSSSVSDLRDIGVDELQAR